MSSKERRGSWPGAPRRPNLDACPGRPLTNDATRWTAGSSSPQVLSASASGPPAARLIGVAELVDTAVAGPAVGDHPRARLDVLGEAGVQRGGRPIGQDRHPSSSVPVRLLNLNGHAYNAFLPLARPPRSPGSAPPMYVSSTSAVPVSRSRPGRTSTERSRCSIAHAVAYEPISARPLQAQRRHAVLARGEQPAGLQPHRQRRSSAIEQRPGRHRRPLAAARALVPPIGHPPAAGMATARTHEALGPAQPVQTVEPVLVGPEPGPELPGRTRIMHTGPGPHLIHSPSA
jgi:hypothetical protein